MTLRLELSQGRLVFTTGDETYSRPFGDNDRGQLCGIARQYRSLRERPSTHALLERGRALFQWFDGPERWGDILGEITPPYLLEIGAKRRPTADERLLLDAPWEILADADGYWCARQYGPHRRLGTPWSSKPRSQAQQDPLAVLFMAAAPDGVRPLDHELEEAAILDATKRAPLDLYVEDSGTASELGEQYRRLSARGTVQVVHISCHGQRDVQPVLLLEDEVGGCNPVDAQHLHDKLTAHRGPHLVFVSACNTASESEPGDMSEAYTRDLVTAGIPAGLGWAASVRDSSAATFAKHLYSNLAEGLSLEKSVARARTELLAPKQGEHADDWHMARLVLGRTGGGALALADTRRKRLRDTPKAFLDADGQVRVAGPDQFVGRRRQLQNIMREFRRHSSRGVLIHGFGRQGKSSLALRVVQRLEGRLKRVVMFGDYSSWRLVELIVQALPGGVGEQWKQSHLKAAENPSALEVALRKLLEGPCHQRGDGQPLLLVIDDFERILEPSDRNDGRYVVKEDYKETLQAIFRAFRDSPSDSRLLLTSRFRFFLPDSDGRNLAEQVFELQLPPMSSQDARKQVNALGLGDGAGGERAKLLERCIVASRGHPGLLDLLVRLLDEDQQRCADALDEMAKGESSGKMPTESKLVEFFQEVAVAALVGRLSPGERMLLRASMVFVVPFPKPVVGALQDALFVGDDCNSERLVSLGLWEQMPDVVDRGRAAVAINGIVRLWLSANEVSNSSDEQKVLAQAVLPCLADSWAELDSEKFSPAAYQLAMLALLSDDSAVLVNFGTAALGWLMSRVPLNLAAPIAASILQVLDRHQVRAPLTLLHQAIRVAQTQDGTWARKLSDQAIEQMTNAAPSPAEKYIWGAIWMGRGDILFSNDRQGAQDAFEQSLSYLSEETHPRETAVLRARIADIHCGRGDLDEALRIYQQEVLPVHERLGDIHSRAITLGRIADIFRTRGEIEEALRIFQEEELPVYERLGDTRSQAMVWRQIADIYHLRGDDDAALQVYQNEVLPVNERLGDTYSRTLTMGRIADVFYARGEVDEALRIYQKLLPVTARLGDVHSQTVIKGKIANIFLARGQSNRALQIFKEELAVFRELDDIRSWALTKGKIAKIYADRGDLDEALRIYEKEELPVYRKIDDIREQAVTLGRIADIYQLRGDVDEALRIYREVQLPMFEALGAVHSQAVTMGRIAQIYQLRGDLDEALRILQEEELPAYERLNDARACAMTMGRIADIFEICGELTEALRICEKQLPVFQRLKDERGAAVAMGRIASIHEARGNLDKALRIFEEEVLPAFQRLNDTREQTLTMARIANLYSMRGELDKAFRITQEQVPVIEKLNDPRSRALMIGRLADIHATRGDLDEALRIRLHEELPVYERLGDIRSRAITLGKVANIYQARGNHAEALRIRQEEVLPVYKKLGEVRSCALTMRRIADIFQLSSKLDEALRIRQSEVLPAFERLGDARERAVTLGKIASIFLALGHTDEALRIYQEELLPVFQSLGDDRYEAITWGEIADIYQARGELEEALRMREKQLPVFERLGDTRSHTLAIGKVADLHKARGELVEALRIRQEIEIPAYEHLNNVRSRAVAMTKIAGIQQALGHVNEAVRNYEEQLAVFEELGDVQSLVITRINLADALCQRGIAADTKKIVSLISEARADAVRNGLTADVQKIDQMLRRPDSD